MKAVNERNLKRAFGDGLAQARVEQGAKLGQLAHESGVPLLNINAFEAGTMMPDLGDLYALAAALEMHPAELLPVLEADELYPEDDEDEDDEDDEDATRDVHRAGG